MIGAARTMRRRRPEDEEQVLDHVDREELGVVALDPGEEGDRDAGEADEEEDRAIDRDGVGGVGGVDPADGPQVGDRGGEQRDHDLRVERSSRGGTPPGRAAAGTSAPWARAGRDRERAPRTGQGERAAAAAERAVGRTGAWRRVTRAFSRVRRAGRLLRARQRIAHMRISARGSGIMRRAPVRRRPGAERAERAVRCAGGARRQALVDGRLDDVHPEEAAAPRGARVAAAGRGRPPRGGLLGLRRPHGLPARRRVHAGPGDPEPLRHRLPHRRRDLRRSSRA